MRDVERSSEFGQCLEGLDFAVERFWCPSKWLQISTPPVALVAVPLRMCPTVSAQMSGMLQSLVDKTSDVQSAICKMALRTQDR